MSCKIQQNVMYVTEKLEYPYNPEADVTLKQLDKINMCLYELSLILKEKYSLNVKIKKETHLLKSTPLPPHITKKMPPLRRHSL